jgi:protein-tyrosine phosphatase
MELFPVEGPWSGRLAVCLRPRSGWFLDDDVLALKTNGYDSLVTAITQDEIHKLDLLGLPDACRRHGVAFHHFPIGNLQVPPAEVALPILRAWTDHLSRGGGIALHCWASVGRSPTLTAALLVLGGVPAEEAWERIARSRGCAVPDTREQREWVARLAVH